MPKKKLLPLLLLAMLLFSACSLFPGAAGPYEKATIAKHIDGDTLVVRMRGQEQRLRMIGVDTPETRHPNKPVEYYGQEASDYTAKQLPVGRTVWLQKDTSETDKYGRLLRYVWKTAPASAEPSEEEMRRHMHNADLLSHGYANPVSYPPDVKYAALFRTLAQEARDNKRGLWAAAPPEARGRTMPPAPHENTGQGTIKGNRKSKVYHKPGQQAYHKIAEHNIVYFNTAEKAEAAGYRAAKQ